jgi:2-oxoglutarate ferredoxin oxidoreductase subunit gamma
VEQQVILCGIGGQGIQLIGKTLALAATMAGRYAMLAADYGGEMRGGPSQASVVIGDAPLRSLPILASSAAAVLMHHKFGAFARERLRPDGLLLLNTSIVPAETDHRGRVAGLPVTAMAREAGAPQSASFVLLGAYIGLTGVVGADEAQAAMRRLLPPYRAQHGDANARAIAAGIAEVSSP